MDEIKFVINTRRLKGKDLIALERGNLSMDYTFELLARFMVGKDGQYVEHDAARVALEDLDIEQIKEAVTLFSQAIQKMQEDIVNPTNAPE